MMMICPRHGAQPAVQVSKDLLDANGSIVHDSPLVEVTFRYQGEAVDLFYVSPQFAKKWGLGGATDLPLPDEYPSWTSEMRILCSRCFRGA